MSDEIKHHRANKNDCSITCPVCIAEGKLTASDIGRMSIEDAQNIMADHLEMRRTELLSGIETLRKANVTDLTSADLNNALETLESTIHKLEFYAILFDALRDRQRDHNNQSPDEINWRDYA